MKTTSYYICLVLLLAGFTNIDSSAQAEINIRVAATGLDTPWEILWGPDDFIWCTERMGIISRINPETGEKNVILDISGEVHEQSEAGLMGMVLHPDFDRSPYVFIVYTIKNPTIEVQVIRYTYNGTELIDPATIFDNVPGGTTHDGARLLIDTDMTLYFTMGDARLQNPATHAQELDNPNGKTLRMNLDGSVPGDNPFVDVEDANPYIWTYGHRNQQGIVKANGILYTAEHGTNIADELNIIEKGRNYGWPEVEGYCNTPSEINFCEENDVVEPIGEYYDSYTLALAGIDYYPQDGPIVEWRHSILMVGLARARFVQAKLSEDGLSIIEENNYFQNEYGRMRDICVSPDGRVFFSTSNRDGRGSPRPGDDKIIELSAKVSSVDTSPGGGGGFNVSPNPFSESTNINFKLSFPGHVVVRVYDMLGNVVAEPVNEYLDASSHSAVFDAAGHPDGMYYYTVRIGSEIRSGKVMLAR